MSIRRACSAPCPAAQVSDECTYTVAMPIVNVRQLARRTSSVIGDVARTGRPAVVTKAGRPIVVVSPIDADAFEDWMLANAPEFVRGMRQADRDVAAGRVVALEDALEELRGARPGKGRRSRQATRRR